MNGSDRVALAAVVFSGIAGQLVLAAVLADPPPRLEPTEMLHPSPGRFEASSMDTRDIWQGRFSGRVILQPRVLVVSMHRSEIRLLEEAPAGVLRAVRVDLAEPTTDGSWRVVAEGKPVEVGWRFESGDVLVLPPMDLALGGVGAGDLRGRWLVATMLVSNPLGHAPLAHAHMRHEAAVELAERAGHMTAAR